MNTIALEKALNDTTTALLELTALIRDGGLSKVGIKEVLASTEELKEVVNSEWVTEDYLNVTEAKIPNDQLSAEDLEFKICDLALILRDAGKMKAIIQSFGVKKLYELDQSRQLELLAVMEKEIEGLDHE